MSGMERGRGERNCFIYLHSTGVWHRDSLDWDGRHIF